MATIRTPPQSASASSLKQAVIRHPLVAYVTLAILVLPVVHFMVRPLAAVSGPSTPDVTRIDAFVRDQVQRHGIPDPALVRCGNSSTQGAGDRCGLDCGWWANSSFP